MSLIDVLSQPGGLGDRLAQVRRDAGLSGLQLAQRLGWGAPKVSKIEKGRQKPSPDEIRHWADVCGLGDDDTRDLLDLLAEAEAEHSQWRHRLRGGGAIRLQAEYDQLVREAKRIRNFEMFVVPGLIQTPSYAREMLVKSSNFNEVSVDVEATLSAKMRRQDVLYEPGREFEFIVLSYALDPLFVPHDVMLGQLDKLLSVAGLPGVTLGIVPAGRLPAIPQEGVLIADHQVVYETSAAAVLVKGQEADLLLKRLHQFSAGSVRGDEARALVLKAADRIRSFN